MNATRPWVILAGLAVVIIPLQVYLLPMLLPDRWVPDLGILAVLWCGLYFGEGVGVVAGLLLGLLYDRFTAGVVGQHIFVLPCVGVGAAVAWRLVSRKGPAARMVVVALFVVIGELAAAVLFALSDAILLDGWSVTHRLVPGITADVLFGAALFGLADLAAARRGAS